MDFLHNIMNFINFGYIKSLLIMLILVGLMLLLHEAGHFIAAKLVGVKVDRFGFGLPIGPTLFSKKFGETELVVHAFLFGGYVSFPDDDEDSDLPKDSPRRFSNKTAMQKFFVLIAGIVGNVILAYALIMLTGAIWKKLPANEYIVQFENFAQSAQEATVNSGLTKGDIIYSINGTKIEYPVAVNKFLTLSAEFDGQVSQQIIDNKFNELKELNPEINTDEEIKIGTKIKLPNFTDEEPLQLTKDEILGIGKKSKDNETKLSDIQKELRDKINYNKEYILEKEVKLIDIAAAISDTKKPINITVLRNGEQIEINTVYTGIDGKLGIQQKYIEHYADTKTFKQLVKATCHYVNYNVNMMLYALGKLFTGKIAFNDMNGIIVIVKVGSDIITYQGLFNGLLFAAIISWNLAIMNLLPIPALDGGHIMFLIIEKITGKPIDKKFIDGLNNFFFYLLIALLVLVCYNDIHALAIGKF